MEILKREELKEVKGGSVLFKTIMGIVTAGSFVIGLIDGIIRPLRCRTY